VNVYILDTDILTLFERGHSSVVARLGQTSFHEIGITVITAEEQIRGRLAQIRRYSSNQGRTQEYLESYRWFRETVEIIRDFSILDYDERAHAIYESLRQQKLRIGASDLRIAAITLSVSGILITRNSVDFGKIAGLAIQDWTA
jgi:tRNA(fMet)-specific endonuclease VapC